MSDRRDPQEREGGDGGPTGLARYRWALAPRWILLHLFVIVCVLGFVRAGLWQLSRLGERRAANALILERRVDAPVPVGQLLSLAMPPAEVANVKYRRVTMEGRYRVEDQVLIRNRSNHTAPGFWVLTPLVQANGTAVAVNRGWIPLILGDTGIAASYGPPDGPVIVVGQVLEEQLREGIGAPDPVDGRLTMLSRVDVPRLQKQVTEPLYPAYVELMTQIPSQPVPAVGVAMPDPVPAPELDDGSHLNYTGQWFIFAALTCLVYPLVLRRTARNNEQEARLAAQDAEDRDSDSRGGHGAKSGPLVDKDGRLAIDIEETTAEAAVASTPDGSPIAEAEIANVTP